MVQRARDQFLARPAFAGHENGRPLRRDHCDRTEDRLHRGTAADDITELVATAHLGSKLLDIALQGRGAPRVQDHGA